MCALCDICSFSSFVGGDGDCVFPTQATFSCKCFQVSCYLPGKGDLGTKIRLPCSQRTPPEVSQGGHSLCLIPVGRRGCLEGFCCPSTGESCRKGVLLTAGLHLGFSCLLVPRYCPQTIIDHPQDQVSAMELTLLCAGLLLWMGPF